ncbi:unnamed protein product [Toxocara canis]|uniref:Zn-binding Pro-Ala-Ala-Arg (PAAR) domain-containing protein, incolved in TypeVI secretion n=1 Tax=Toxocara canis TaxID=6265 RepID=A0A183UVI4_TOXCA|nr:unnamed protein product [Toxocara canis]
MAIPLADETLDLPDPDETVGDVRLSGPLVTNQANIPAGIGGGGICVGTGSNGAGRVGLLNKYGNEPIGGTRINGIEVAIVAIDERMRCGCAVEINQAAITKTIQ